MRVLLLACALLPPASADSPAPAVDMTASVQVLGNVPVEEVQTLVMAKRAEILACNPSVAGFIGYAVLPAAAAPPFVEWKASSFVEPDIPHCVRDVLRRVGWPVPARYGVTITFVAPAPAIPGATPGIRAAPAQGSH